MSINSLVLEIYSLPNFLETASTKNSRLYSLAKSVRDNNLWYIFLLSISISHLVEGEPYIMPFAFNLFANSQTFKK